MCCSYKKGTHMQCTWNISFSFFPLTRFYLLDGKAAKQL